jgi:hypothetical protein
MNAAISNDLLPEYGVVKWVYACDDGLLSFLVVIHCSPCSLFIHSTSITIVARALLTKALKREALTRIADAACLCSYLFYCLSHSSTHHHPLLPLPISQKAS